jgi:hypothetical protein
MLHYFAAEFFQLLTVGLCIQLLIPILLVLQGIFRRPKQCKERHKALMDRLSAGDGGDSPEDPSTSQPHQSNLPGIPKVMLRDFLSTRL